MCGIAGSTQDPGARDATAMAAAMVHRGPDDEGVYADPDFPVSLSARRLSIIDVAGGHQPVANEDRSVWAVLNGEIYNHASLREQLRGRGHFFASATDTEVLVHLYEEYGSSLVHALEGMYAFAIWDRNSRQLLLARDRFGEKPLFYAEDGDRLVFASELTALRRGLPVVPEIDAHSLDAFFLLGYVPGERTIFEGVRSLPQASTLTWSQALPRSQISSYWSMPARATSSGATLSELAEEGGHLLRMAVRSRLAADVPVGVFLSGGLDSALVASIAATESSSRLKTFTVTYDVGDVGEGKGAQATARRLATDHHEVVLTSEDVSRRAPALVALLDQPNADPALVALHTVAELAHGEVKVAVGGEGADELFGGYPRYRWLVRAAWLDGHLSPELARTGAGLIRSLVRSRRVGRLADVLEPRSLELRNLDWVTAGRLRTRLMLYGPRLRGQADGNPVLATLVSSRADSGARDVAARAMSLDQRLYLPDDVLSKADRATMLVSLEMRTPYLSRELAEFSATIPASTHLSGGGKAVLRAIARRSPGIADTGRAKRAFRVPMASWLRGPLAPALREQVAGGRLVTEGWIDQRRLHGIVDAHCSGRADHSSLLWPVLVAGLWLDRLRTS